MKIKKNAVLDVASVSLIVQANFFKWLGFSFFLNLLLRKKCCLCFFRNQTFNGFMWVLDSYGSKVI